VVDLSSIQTNISNFSTIIQVTPDEDVGIQPQLKANEDPGSSGLAPFFFQIIDEDSATLTSDITDHYVENNTPIQDNISLKPEIVTVRGFIAELNDVPPSLLAGVKKLADKLTTLEPYVPGITSTALDAYAAASSAYATADAALSAVSSGWNALTGGAQAQNKQQKAYSFFYGYWMRRQLFTVQTPWAIFNNMAIQTLRMVQDGETRVISDIEITFKKMRFADTEITTVQGVQGRLLSQASQVINQGITRPTDVGSVGTQITASGLG
jgi:hypothetical protein